MGRKLLFSVAVGSSVALCSPQAYGLHCENPDQDATVSDSSQMDFKGSAETLFVIGSLDGLSSERFRVNVDRLNAQSPDTDWHVLSNRLIYAYCTVLVTATELRPEAKVALLKQFTEKIRELDAQEAYKMKLAVASSQTDPRRVAGDWDCLSNGHLEAAFLRIRVDSEGRIAIEQINTHDDPHNPRLAEKVSDVRLEGNDLSYNLHFPAGRASRVRLEIIYRDLMSGTYSWSGLATAMSYELRRRRGPEDEVIATEPGPLGAASSTAANTR